MDCRLDFGGLEEVKSWNWSAGELFSRVDEFRRSSIGGLTPECYGNREIFGELLFEYPDCWKMIYDQDRAVRGFWQFIPVTDEGFEDSVRGRLYAARVRREIIATPQPGWHDAYFFSLSICPTVRRSMIAIGFSGTILQGLIEQARRGIFYDRMSMCLASRYSMAINRSFFHFDYCCEHPFSGKIHQTRLPEFLNRNMVKISLGKNVRELRSLYNAAIKKAPEHSRTTVVTRPFEAA